MRDTATPRPVQVQTCDGALTYLVDLPPEALPAVRGRDLAAAWDAAHAAATAASWGTPRLFRFRRGDGTSTDLALADPDACCWAEAVDGTVGMGTSYGMSLCLRLLALVDLLATATWAAALVSLRRDGAEIAPVALATAATLPLTREARFDEIDFRSQVGHTHTRAIGRNSPGRSREAIRNPRMNSRAAGFALTLLALAGCARSAPQTHEGAVERAACRQRADQVYTMQNRDQVYRSDTYATSTRDAPFAGSGLSSVTSSGLSGQFSRASMVEDCLRSSAGTAGDAGATSAAPTPDASVPH